MRLTSIWMSSVLIELDHITFFPKFAEFSEILHPRFRIVTGGLRKRSRIDDVVQIVNPFLHDLFVVLIRAEVELVLFRVLVVIGRCRKT